MNGQGRSIFGRKNTDLLLTLIRLAADSCMVPRAFIIMSPYLGPLLGAFMVDTKPWPTPFWVYTALCALALILAVLFVQETYYDRRIPANEQPPKGSRVARLTGVAQWRSRHLRNSVKETVWRVVSVILKPTNFLASMFYLLVCAEP